MQQHNQPTPKPLPRITSTFAALAFGLAIGAYHFTFTFFPVGAAMCACIAALASIYEKG